MFIRTADALRSLILVPFLRDMSRKAKQSDKPLKQQTLASFIHSSPQRVPQSPINSKSHIPQIGSQRTSARKPEPASVPADNNENDDSDGDTSDVDAIRFEPDVIELSDEDASPRRPTAHHRNAPPTQARGMKLDDDSSDFFSARSDGSGLESQKKVILGKRKQVAELSESEEEDMQPRRRKLIKGTRPPSIDSDDDLMEEVEEHREPWLYILQALFRHTAVRYITEAHAHSRQKDSISEEFGKTQKFVRASAILRICAKPIVADRKETGPCRPVVI